jgi:hypothetical protein
LQFVNAHTQPHLPIAEPLRLLLRSQAPDRCHRLVDTRPRHCRSKARCKTPQKAAEQAFASSPIDARACNALDWDAVGAGERRPLPARAKPVVAGTADDPFLCLSLALRKAMVEQIAMTASNIDGLKRINAPILDQARILR